MDKTILNVCIQNKYDTDTNWRNVNPVLRKGEQVIALDEDERVRTKTGDGVTSYSLLSFDDEYLLDSVSVLQKKISELAATVEDINSYIEGLQQGEVLLVQPMLTAKIQDNE